MQIVEMKLNKSCFGFILNELNLKKIGFDHSNKMDFYRSQWQLKETSWSFLIFRWILALFFIAVFTVCAVLQFSDGKFFIFLTNWGIFMCLLTQLLAAILATLWHFNIGSLRTKVYNQAIDENKSENEEKNIRRKAEVVDVYGAHDPADNRGASLSVNGCSNDSLNAVAYMSHQNDYIAANNNNNIDFEAGIINGGESDAIDAANIRNSLGNNLIEVAKPSRAILFIVKLYWLLHVIALAQALVITIVYWIFLHGNKPVRFPVISFITHCLNSVVMLVDFMVVAFPVRILHTIYPMLFSTTYCLFTVVYFFCGGVDEFGNHYVYPILDWTTPLRGIITFIGVFGLFTLNSFILFVIYQIKRLLQALMRITFIPSAAGFH